MFCWILFYKERIFWNFPACAIRDRYYYPWPFTDDEVSVAYRTMYCLYYTFISPLEIKKSRLHSSNPLPATFIVTTKDQ